MYVCIRCSRSRDETNAMSRIPPSGANDRALSHQTHSLLQTAGFVCPRSVASRSVAAHRAVASATSNTPRRKPSCLQQQRQQEQQGWRAGARGGSEHVLGARRRDDFFDDDDDDLYDDLDLDDRFSAAPQKRKRPKVPLLPATLSKVSSLYIHIPSFYDEALNVAWVGGEKRRRLKRCGPVRAAVGCGKRVVCCTCAWRFSVLCFVWRSAQQSVERACAAGLPWFCASLQALGAPMYRILLGTIDNPFVCGQHSLQLDRART